ncbi:exported hypothetical protein [Candidatus Magnetomoraceae bacterium gMMP-15]
MKYILNIINIFLMVLILCASSVKAQSFIEWKKYTNAAQFNEICKKITDEAVQAKEHKDYPWSELSGKLWTEAEDLKNSQQNDFQNKLKVYNEVEVDIENVKKQQAIYSALITTLKTLEDSKKALQKTYLQSLRDIDTTVLVYNCKQIDAVSSLKKELSKMEKEIENYIKENYIKNNKSGLTLSEINSETSYENGRLKKDIIVFKEGMKLESYPSDPIVDYQPTSNKRLINIYKIKALRIFSILSLNNKTLYDIPLETNITPCKSCKFLNNINDLDIKLSSAKQQDLERLIADIENHNSIQTKHFSNLNKIYSKQISSLEKQINLFKSQQSNIETEVEEMAKGDTYVNIISKDTFTNWHNYDEIFATLIQHLKKLKKDKQDELNKVYSKSEKIVYTLKRVLIPEIEDADKYFLNIVNPNNTDSYFNYLIYRLQELQQIEVTVVENDVLISVKGNEYYYKPSQDSIKKFAIIGPEFGWDSEKYRSATFIIALKADLIKMDCPSGQGTSGIFEETTFYQAKKICRSCSLPTLRNLCNNNELPNGEYWSIEKEGKNIKILVKGRKNCEKYENHILMSGYFEKITENIGIILKPESSAAKFYCIEREIQWEEE